MGIRVFGQLLCQMKFYYDFNKNNTDILSVDMTHVLDPQHNIF